MIYVIFATSCNDNVIEDIDNNMTEYQKENKPRSNKENIYMEQTDHIAMLTRLVWFDKGSSKYILALSKEDAYKMGFTLNEYLSVENYVKTLNQIKVLHNPLAELK